MIKVWYKFYKNVTFYIQKEVFKLIEISFNKNRPHIF